MHSCTSLNRSKTSRLRLSRPRLNRLVILALCLPAAEVKGYEERVCRAGTAQGGMIIDGHLTESSWQGARFHGGFVQQDPDEGAPASEKTEVALLGDKDYLYIGVKCFDSQPQHIIAKEMRRDQPLFEDDCFMILLDTYRDRRNGYFFVTNPHGAKQDASIGDEGLSYNGEWDGIWRCAARIGDRGWFAEIAIPWKTLRFTQADSQIWGVNFARYIRRKNEHAAWQFIPRDAGRFGFLRSSLAGALRDLAPGRSGGTWELEPYLLGGRSRDNTELPAGWEDVGEIGLDAKFSLTSTLAAKLTLNTDFAQVESDQERVNLTRFSLFFPEKRDFFLEGAELFNFGSERMGGQYFRDDELFYLFYSRRIGIVEGHQQPILGGAKMLGRLGPFQIGALNITANELDAVEDDSLVHYPSVNYTALRLRRDLFKRSSIGVMLLNREEIDSDHFNRSGGFDLHMPLSDRIILSAALAATTGPDPAEQRRNRAAKLSFEYESDLWEFNFAHFDIQDQFNAEMGFIPRTGIRRTQASAAYSPRPANSNFVRQYSYRMRANYLTDQDNQLLDRELTAYYILRFQNSAYIFSGLRHFSERLEEEWEVRPGYLVPVSRYRGNSFFIWARSDESDDIAYGLYTNYGDYYTGTRLQIRPSLVMKSIPRFRADLDLSLNHVRLPQGQFDARTLGLRLSYFFSTRLYLKAYLQWKDDRKANEGDQIALANLLLRWIYRPGSELYLVYNDGRRFNSRGMVTEGQSLMLKATIFLRK